jgi:hypothetical protein
MLLLQTAIYSIKVFNNLIKVTTLILLKSPCTVTRVIGFRLLQMVGYQRTVAYQNAYQASLSAILKHHGSQSCCDETGLAAVQDARAARANNAPDLSPLYCNSIWNKWYDWAQRIWEAETLTSGYVVQRLEAVWMNIRYV